MGTNVHTPPIDLYEESQEHELRDDREMGFVFPDDNGDLDEESTSTSEERLHAVLGW